MRFSTMLLPVLASVLAVGCQGIDLHRGGIEVSGDSVQAKIGFTDEERSLIREYYRGRNGLPPGLAKKDKLPPGLRKRRERRGSLPPGLQSRPLPPDLERQLHTLPEGYIRVRVGGDIVLMDQKTHVAIDAVFGIGD